MEKVTIAPGVGWNRGMLRGCDLVALKVHDVAPSGPVAPRAIVMRRKPARPVQFEITEQTRDAVAPVGNVRGRSSRPASNYVAPRPECRGRAARSAR